MKDQELISFELINGAASAMDFYNQSMEAAKQGNFRLAQEKLEEGKKHYILAHGVHAALLKESTEKEIRLDLLLMHAEDQMMFAESLAEKAREMIDCYTLIYELKKEIQDVRHRLDHTEDGAE